MTATTQNEITTREQYLELFADRFEAGKFEGTCLSVGREFLPRFAIEVLDKTVEEPSPEYWQWLAESVAQAELEYAESEEV